MKNKNKSRYVKQINDLMHTFKGWPLYILIEDRRAKYQNEYRYHLQRKKYYMSKKGRLDGSYYVNLGIHPSRISHGHKHGSFFPDYEDYLS